MSKSHAPLAVFKHPHATTRVILSGDWHGDSSRISAMIGAAVRTGVKRIIVLGDFGYWEHAGDGVKYLDSINKFAALAGVMVDFIDGNHDNHPLLWSKYVTATSPRNEYGFYEIRPHVHYIPRGHRWTMGTTSFVALGGANSTDKDWRIARETTFTVDDYGRRRKPTGVGTLWWPTEDITEADLLLASSGGHADVVLTHDAPLGVDIPSRKDQPESEESRRKVRALVDSVTPQRLFHGHFHIRKTSTLQAAWGEVEVTGLGDNRRPVEEQLLVLEV